MFKQTEFIEFLETKFIRRKETIQIRRQTEIMNPYILPSKCGIIKYQFTFSPSTQKLYMRVLTIDALLKQKRSISMEVN